MRSVWSCPSCAVLLLVSLVGREASASHAGRQGKNVHRIPKAQVTAHPLRRDEGTCSTEYSLCAASLSGGCCPSRYACATDSCYATTAGPTTACGKAGYFPCAPTNGEGECSVLGKCVRANLTNGVHLAGCCPVGYVCGKGGSCLLPAGVSNTATQCPNDYFLCPASDNYGCCKVGMGCAPNACYSTAPVTTTLIQAITTTSGTHTVTTTKTAVTIATPTPPSGLPADNTDVAAKFIPTSVPKLAASSPSGGSSSGLSGGAIGGIIAGVVILLVAVVVAAFLIIRRLKRVENMVESRRGSSSGKKSKPQSQMQHNGRHLHSDIDDTSVDPLMVPANTTANPSSTATTPKPGGRGRADSSSTSANNHIFNFTDARSRHTSPDSAHPAYFDDIHHQQQQPMQPARIRGSSTDSSAQQQQQQQRRGYAYHHWRQQSNASELSADGSENAAANVHSPLVAGAAELEASSGGVVEVSSSAGGAPAAAAYQNQYGYGQQQQHGQHAQGQAQGGYTPVGMRSRSSSAASGTHGRGRSDGQGGLMPLDEEVAEIQVHGYYGRRDQQAGQTAAGLDGQGGYGGGGGGGDGSGQAGSGGGGGYFSPEEIGREPPTR